MPRALYPTCKTDIRLDVILEDPTFQAASAEAQAGFVAHLLMLAGDDADTEPALDGHLTTFARLAGLTADQDDAARDACVAAFYARYPLDPVLLRLLEAEEEAVAAEAANDLERASDRLGISMSNRPIGTAPIAGTFRGGPAARLGARDHARLGGAHR